MNLVVHSFRLSRAFTLAFCLLSPSLSPNRAAPPESKSREQALRALEDKWLASEHDPQALQSILADDFIHVLPSGFITKQQQIEFFKTHRTPETPRHFEDLRIRIYGDTGIANGSVVAASADGGAPLKTLFTDVFVYRAGRWQAVNAQELPMPPSHDRP